MELRRFRAILVKLAVESAAAEFRIEIAPSISSDDLNYALLCVSALTGTQEESAQDAILRVVHGVLRHDDSSDEQKSASLLLLERVGNHLAAELAVSRYGVDELDFELVPVQLALDGLARQSQLTLDMGGPDGPRQVNPFQQQFWELVNRVDWVSVSAPTSAGKSHIVKDWMVSQLLQGDSCRLVYLAPTRALVEEIGADFRRRLEAGIGVHTLPWDPQIPDFERQVFVLTQERLHLLQERAPQFSPDVIFVDEAQKISEGSRGILLSQVLDEAVQRHPGIRLVFASPLSENPGILLSNDEESRTVAALVGHSVTVNQNLIYASQKPRSPSIFQMDLRYLGEEHSLGEIELSTQPGRVGDRVPYVAVAVAGLSFGNLVYANGPAEAEKYARAIYQALGSEGDLESDAVEELIDFARGVVHQRFELAEFARRGVAFHYGDMPMVLKAKVEELFKRGEIRYLVCTSTLLEGVNLPCRNIFVRGPRKGRDHMSMGDFWNLAGRAGRWGKEFQGNIYCVDAEKPSVWHQKPSDRERTVIYPAAVRTLTDPAGVVDYINSGGQMAGREISPELESTFSWLSGRFLAHGTLSGLTGVALESTAVGVLNEAVSASVARVTLPTALIKRHAGISPLSMQRLFDAVLEHGHPEVLTLVPPASDDAVAEYDVALTYVSEYLGGSFTPEMRRKSLANLIVNWMRGLPMGRIIDGKAKWRRENGITFNYPTLIRKTMEDVEDIARFEAPRYLACFADIVAAAASQLGREIQPQVEDIEMMLELGVPRVTDMSFIAAGLSRATSREIVLYTPDPSMTPAACIEWIKNVDPEQLDIPAFAVREITQQRSLLLAREWGAV